MTASVEDKASIKKQLIPFTIGAFLFFGVMFVIDIIIELSKAI